MNTTQQKNLLTIKNLVVALFGIFILFVLVNSLIDKRFEKIEENTRSMITDQERRIVSISNLADSQTGTVIKDCDMLERTAFDELLGSLDRGLSQEELVKLDRLFGRCGSFYSDQKNVMVSQLSREIDIYKSYIKLLGAVLGEDFQEEYKVEKWQELASKEIKQSEYFSELVSLQDEIISALLNGNAPNSPEISEILQRVSDIKGNLLLAAQQTNEIRSSLMSSD